MFHLLLTVFHFIIKYFNLFFLERKFDSIKDRELINILWEQCIPNKLYTFVTLDENLKSLSKIDNNFQNSNAICNVKKIIEDGTNLDILQKYFLEILNYLSVYCYSLLFPQNNRFGIQNKVSFTIHFKQWKDSKIKPIVPTAAPNEIPIKKIDLTKLAKEPQNYNRGVNKFEQKPIDVDKRKFVLVKKTKPIKHPANLKGKVQLDA